MSQVTLNVILIYVMQDASDEGEPIPKARRPTTVSQGQARQNSHADNVKVS